MIQQLISEFTQYLTNCLTQSCTSAQCNDIIQYFTNLIDHSPHLINNNFNINDIIHHLTRDLDQDSLNYFSSIFNTFFTQSQTYQTIINTHRPHLFKQRLIEYLDQNKNPNPNPNQNQYEEKHYILYDADEISTHNFTAISDLHAFYVYCEQFCPEFYTICAEGTSLPLHTLDHSLKEYINQQLQFVTNHNSPEFFIQVY